MCVAVHLVVRCVMFVRGHRVVVVGSDSCCSCFGLWIGCPSLLTMSVAKFCCAARLPGAGAAAPHPHPRALQASAAFTASFRKEGVMQPMLQVAAPSHDCAAFTHFRIHPSSHNFVQHVLDYLARESIDLFNGGAYKADEVSRCRPLRILVFCVQLSRAGLHSPFDARAQAHVPARRAVERLHQVLHGRQHLPARIAEVAMQELRGQQHLLPWQAEECLQELRRYEFLQSAWKFAPVLQVVQRQRHLQAWETQTFLQRLRGQRHLPARQAEDEMQRLWRQRHLRARKTEARVPAVRSQARKASNQASKRGHSQAQMNVRSSFSIVSAGITSFWN